MECTRPEGPGGHGGTGDGGGGGGGRQAGRPLCCPQSDRRHRPCPGALLQHSVSQACTCLSFPTRAEERQEPLKRVPREHRSTDLSDKPDLSVGRRPGGRGQVDAGAGGVGARPVAVPALIQLLPWGQPRALSAHGAAPLPLCQVGTRPGAPGLSMATPRASAAPPRPRSRRFFERPPQGSRPVPHEGPCAPMRAARRGACRLLDVLQPGDSEPDGHSWAGTQQFLECTQSRPGQVSFSLEGGPALPHPTPSPLLDPRSFGAPSGSLPALPGAGFQASPHSPDSRSWCPWRRVGDVGLADSAVLSWRLAAAGCVSGCVC